MTVIKEISCQMVSLTDVSRNVDFWWVKEQQTHSSLSPLSSGTGSDAVVHMDSTTLTFISSVRSAHNDNLFSFLTSSPSPFPAPPTQGSPLHEPN